MKEGKDMKVYLDNGATTRTAEEVLKAMQPYFSEKFGNASSIHSLGSEAKDALDESRQKIADEINAEADEIIFTSGGTESDNLAIKGIAYGIKDKGKHIITSNIEHPAVLKTCEKLESEGFSVTYVGVDKEGAVNIKDIEKAIKKETILVTIMHANNEIGTIQPIKEIGKLCRKKGIMFHTDAVQSFTKEKIDVKEMNIDLMSLSAHKIHGPKGIGALFVRKEAKRKIKPMYQGGSHEYSLRPGTENIPSIVGFAKATELVSLSDIERMRDLKDKLIKGLLDIPDTILNGSRDHSLCNNVNISFKFIEGESLLLHLDMKGIAVSTGSACSSHSLEPSYVLVAIGLPAEVAHGSIRFTLSKYTTSKEIEYVLKEVPKIVDNLRKISPLAGGEHGTV